MGAEEDEGGLMPSRTEVLNRHLVRALYDATEGTPQAWQSLAGLGKGSLTCCYEPPGQFKAPENVAVNLR